MLPNLCGTRWPFFLLYEASLTNDSTGVSASMGCASGWLIASCVLIAYWHSIASILQPAVLRGLFLTLTLTLLSLLLLPQKISSYANLGTRWISLYSCSVLLCDYCQHQLGLGLVPGWRVHLIQSVLDSRQPD